MKRNRVHCLHRLKKQLQEFIAKEAAAAAAAGRRSKKVTVTAAAQLPTIHKSPHGALSALQPVVLSVMSKHLHVPMLVHSRQWFCTVTHWVWLSCLLVSQAKRPCMVARFQPGS